MDFYQPDFRQLDHSFIGFSGLNESKTTHFALDPSSKKKIHRDWIITAAAS
jgi:hypothetical protein